MRILLIEPPKARLTIGGEDLFLYEPLALEYVAAGVLGDHDARILDMRVDKNLQAVLDTYQPDVVGITAYTVHVNVVRRLFAEVKRRDPQVLTVVGGHHASLVPEDFLSPSIDLVVIGEGVEAFREAVARFERKKPLDGIPGTAFAREDEQVIVPRRSVVDLDALPFPERRLTAAYRKHYNADYMKPIASIRTSKGYPHRCSFCALWKLTEGHYLRREPARIVEELAGIGEECVFFADDESLIDVTRMKTLATEIRNAGIRKRYFLYGRSDTIASNPDLLQMWKDIGLERVFVGLQFFSDRDLAYIGKGSTIADNERAVEILQKLGIDIYASFIVRPEFGKEDIVAMRMYCRRLNLGFASFAVLTPLPGTGFYDEVKDRLITQNYDMVDFIHTLLPTTLPLKEFYEEYFRMLRGAVPFRKSLQFLAKYPLTDLPRNLVKAFKIFGRLKTVHSDYES